MKKREIITLIVFCLILACILTGARKMKVKERHPRPDKDTVSWIDTIPMITTINQ